MSIELNELDPTERRHVDALLDQIVAGREARAEKITACIAALREADEATLTVTRVLVDHLLEGSDPTNAFSDPDRWIAGVSYQAPGLFMANILFKRLRATGEFVGTPDFKLAAESLHFAQPDEKAWLVTEYLFQWTAARYPGSPAAKAADDYGLRSGRMSHAIHGRGDFSTNNVLFHREIAAKSQRHARYGEY